jgi:hypothetical protein
MNILVFYRCKISLISYMPDIFKERKERPQRVQTRIRILILTKKRAGNLISWRENAS